MDHYSVGLCPQTSGLPPVLMSITSKSKTAKISLSSRKPASALITKTTKCRKSLSVSKEQSSKTKNTNRCSRIFPSSPKKAHSKSSLPITSAPATVPVLFTTAPGFGEEDYLACKAYDMPEVCPIDEHCCFTSEISDYAGRFVKECDKDIMRRLKEEGKLVHRGSIKHSYPHCWRDDSPLIYRAISTWFVDISKVKEKMIAANQKINWTPDHLQNGRFGKWLENAPRLGYQP